MTTQALNDLADKVVIANATGNETLYSGAVSELLTAVRTLATVSDASPSPVSVQPECDCENPEPKSGPALVSMECSVHNENPRTPPHSAHAATENAQESIRKAMDLMNSYDFMGAYDILATASSTQPAQTAGAPATERVLLLAKHSFYPVRPGDENVLLFVQRLYEGWQP